MNNLRKANAAGAEIMKDLNTATTDQELDSLMNLRVDDLIHALSLLPHQMRELTLSNFVDLIIDDEPERKLEELIPMDSMSEEEQQKFGDELAAFGKFMEFEDEEP